MIDNQSWINDIVKNPEIAELLDIDLEIAELLDENLVDLFLDKLIEVNEQSSENSPMLNEFCEVLTMHKEQQANGQI